MLRPIFVKNFSVPPVDNIFIPSEESFFAKGSMPFLSKTDINAVLICNIIFKKYFLKIGIKIKKTFRKSFYLWTLKISNRDLKIGLNYLNLYQFVQC